jgi:hypothetical protein
MTEPGMNDYSWSVSSGGTIAGPSNGSSIAVTWNTSGVQWVGVTYSNANGCGANSPTILNVSVNPFPGTPGLITGAGQVVQGQAGVGYSLSVIPGATGYLWTLPAGATIVSGANTNNIVVDFSTNAVSGNISVHATNACGNGLESQVFNVQVVPTAVSLENISVGSGQTNCYGAAQTIYVAGSGTAFAVQNGGSATMVAGHNILYRPTTTVAPGGYMHGYITMNNQYCGIQPPPMVAIAAGAAEIVPAATGILFKVYPNPTTGSFTLEFADKYPSGTIDVAIYSMKGEKLSTYEMTGERSHVFSLSDRPSGLYFIHFLTGTKTETVKVIRQ